ncbi:glycosyltransferase [Reinekea marinisedimentorum]|uniref:Cellulose synthase/poly-beta-1,6-N-acetylglucosamine synthase-like glycosyltransferase n=1 Tax=Reinekea marinisedimentorum TaxID=230495 RepID=A0A4R3IE98_9GAMM|nr:glycosyltransferase [Reinekea marinisedimentorum]TCS44116.1 cellulose synthase/poly-beta-1,6-N-acetylglucosamine synthase-like glycosyltransferase [Reinekea marinisedimentorum]
MHSYSVSVVIPAYNEERYLSSCLDSITQQKLSSQIANYEVVVVDNGSTDKTLQIAKQYPVKVLSSKAKYVGGVRNDGVKATSGDVLVFLDSDCVADEGWVSRCLELLVKKNLSAIGGYYNLRQNPSFFERYWILNDGNSGENESLLVGGCIVTWRKEFNQVGGFPDYLTAGEDSAYTKLMQGRNGCKVDPSLNVVHLGYPDTFRSFASRQVWQSSSYIQNLRSSIRETVFLLLLAHIFIGIAFIVLLLVTSWLSVLAIIAWLTLPVVFSFKRIYRASYRASSHIEYIKIYCVDLLYIVSRDIGVIKSSFMMIFNQGISKSRVKD